MDLDVNKETMTIMGVSFENRIPRYILNQHVHNSEKQAIHRVRVKISEICSILIYFLIFFRNLYYKI